MKTIQPLGEVVSALTQNSKTTAAPTIGGFLQQKIQEAASPEAAVLMGMADRLTTLGFTRTSNIRLTDYMKDFKEFPKLAAYYKEKYPACTFLSWNGLHRVLRTLSLVINTPSEYLGAVPNEQLIGIEMLDFEESDSPHPVESTALFFTPGFTAMPHLSLDLQVKLNNDYSSRSAKAFVAHLVMYADRIAYDSPVFSSMSGGISVRFADHDKIMVFGRHSFRVIIDAPSRLAEVELNQCGPRALQVLKNTFKALHMGLLVVAPRAAFVGGESFEEKQHKAWIAAKPEPKTYPIPPDPLVIKLCHGGCLVVAAWGDEASMLNEITNALDI